MTECSTDATAYEEGLSVNRLKGHNTAMMQTPSQRPHQELNHGVSLRSGRGSRVPHNIVVRIEVHDTGVGIKPRDMIDNRVSFGAYRKVKLVLTSPFNCCSCSVHMSKLRLGGTRVARGRVSDWLLFATLSNSVAVGLECKAGAKAVVAFGPRFVQHIPSPLCNSTAYSPRATLPLRFSFLLVFRKEIQEHPALGSQRRISLPLLYQLQILSRNCRMAEHRTLR